MKTSFRKLVISLLVVLGIFSFTPAAIAANALGTKVTYINIFTDSSNVVRLTVLGPGADASQPSTTFYYYRSSPSAGLLMALSTAFQRQENVTWFVRDPNDPYADPVDQYGYLTGGGQFGAIALQQDQTGLPPNTPYFMRVGNSNVVWSSTPDPSCPGCGRSPAW